MYRSALRSSPLRAIRPSAGAQLVSAPATRRFASSSSSKRGTWKGTGVRWGLAAGAVYFYNTSPIFSDEIPEPITAPAQFSDSDLPTIDALIESKRKQAAASAARPPPPAAEPTGNAVEAAIEKVTQEESDKDEAASPPTTEGEGVAPPAGGFEPGSPEALEQEASQQGAFNPETGEINWDCPCLGGMAHGPCGEEFKAAFSCFVYSKEEPKGMDCIDKFQHMQDCFRQYPEIYGAELADDEEGAAAPEGAQTEKPAGEEPIPTEATDATEANITGPTTPPGEIQKKLEEEKKAQKDIPAEAADATSANKKTKKQ
ncbi:putative intermembrane space import and assembly protein 40, mitochondrial precursor [Podospora australis]|uniref:Mitochondrial intermembrane space import and assembly protein 40 n=1 Tax=Podospora australis TaxID=1536484 RepID=A0AAN6WLJ2_9PEZI|nr:putative intermembrane space import and assembly protein 40, mitochondrial precursor [Podospora australis]